MNRPTPATPPPTLEALPFPRLPSLGLKLLFLAVAVAVNCAQGEADPFEWRTLPDSALLRPQSEQKSRSFRILERTDEGMVVAFEHPPLVGEAPDIRDRFHFVLVSPAGGVESVSTESAVHIYYLGDEVVDPTETVVTPDQDQRTVIRRFGEIRGAALTAIEFLPLSTLRGHSQVNRVWIPAATLEIRFRNPLGESVEVSPLLKEAVEAVAFNGDDFSRCLPEPDPDAFLDPDRFRDFSRPTLKVTTREGGWTGIPGRRLLTEWGRDCDLAGLSVLKRGPLIELPSEWKESADSLPESDRPVPFIVVDASGERRLEGRIDPSDTLLFLAEASTFWNDPLDCYWVVYDPSRRNPVAPPSPEPAVGANDRIHSTALRVEVLGEDNLFLEGGLKNEQQEFFWVDRPFPKEAGDPFVLPLPEWTIESDRPVKARMRVAFPSTVRDRYQPGGYLRPVDISLRVGGATASINLSGSPSRYGQEISFRIPDSARDATLEIRCEPSRPLTRTPYFDFLLLETDEEMAWSGESKSFDFPASASGTFVVQPSDAATVESLRSVVGVTDSGEAAAPHRLRTEGRIECDFETPIRSLHLFAGAGSNAPVSIERFTPPSWVATPPRVEQLVIAPDFFRAEAEELVRTLGAEGWTAAYIDLGDVFDLFGGGRFSAHSLRNFLVWATKAWPHPQPASVLLVGDSSWDFWGRYPESDRVPNWTPSYHTHSHPDYPTDLWFVEGEPLDRIADWLWGRIPCQTLDHLQGYLAKRRAFNREPWGDWSERMIWISDDNDPVERNVREILENSLPLAYRFDPIFLHDHVYVDNFYYGENLARIQQLAREEAKPLDFGKISPDCNAAILSAIDRGAAICVYYGHSGLNVLGHERILFGGGSQHSDIPKLQNEGKAPLFFLMTCDVGRFDYTHDRLWKWSYGLAEELLMHPFGGSLALVTSTGRGVPSDHLVFVSACLDALHHKGTRHAGTLFWAGKTESAASVRKNEAVEMFTLLGDPLFRVPLPPARDLFEASRFRWTENGEIEIEAAWIEGEEPRTLGRVWRFDPATMREHEDVDRSDLGGEGVRFRIPEAHFLEQVWLGYEYESSGVRLTGKLTLDLSGFERPDWRALDSDEKPNLAVTPDDIRFENYSPRNGETLFARVRVHNLGPGTAWEIEVEGRDQASGEPILNIADSHPPARIDRLGPGESGEVRLRWDHWESVGVHVLEVEVDPENRIDETDKSDNIASKSIRVLDKPDLGWGFIRDSTAGAVAFDQARAIPADWVLEPDAAQIGVWAPLRPYLKQVDRGATLLVPLTNFGESLSATCTIELSYFRENAVDPFREPIEFRVGPIEPTEVRGGGKKFPVLLLPGLDRVRIEIDPGLELEEGNRENNTLRFKVPAFFWDDFPSLKPSRLPPKVLQRLNTDE